MSYSQTSDKRRFLRYEVLDYALVYTPDCPQPVHAVIVDIGLGGLQLRSKLKLSVGAHCQIHIGRLHNESLVLAGEIRHSLQMDDSELVGTGVRFSPENHEDRMMIAEYVHDVFQRQCDKLLL